MFFKTLFFGFKILTCSRVLYWTLFKECFSTILDLCEKKENLYWVLWCTMSFVTDTFRTMINLLSNCRKLLFIIQDFQRLKEMDWYSLKMCMNKIHGIYKLFTCSKVYNRKLKDITSNYMLFQEKRAKFLLHDISAILNLISVLENSHEVPASWIRPYLETDLGTEVQWLG